MMRVSPANFLIGGLLIVVSFAAPFFVATTYIAETETRYNLNDTIPAEFADWKAVATNSASIINPEQNELIDKLYSQNFSRTYANSKGDVIMLAIAYGRDQRKDTQLHYPEVCYRAQGFSVSDVNKYFISLNQKEVPIKRLVAETINRIEPITYWTTLGNKVVNGGVESRMLKLKYGLNKKIPDGLLFRVSNISSNNSDIQYSYTIHDKFIMDLFSTLNPSYQTWLAGI